MKIIRPLSIVDSVLTSSNVTEADYSAYAAGTTYALGDKVILVAPSSTVTMTIANPCVVTWTGHGQPVGTQVKFTTTGALPTGISAGTTYYIASVTTDTFTISATSGGANIATSGTQSGVHTATTQVHKIFESLQAANTGHYPTLAASSTWWLDCGATNRWKMFDSSVTSQTSNTTSIATVFAAVGRVDSVALLNCSAASAQITMTDAIDGVVYNQTYSMVADSGIQDWYAWFFEPIVRIRDLAITDMPPYAGASIAVTLTDTGATVLCGGCVLGTVKDTGGTQYGATVGIQDYSVKTQDTFGNYTITERAFAKRATFQVWVDSAYVDALENLLSDYRATPIVYIGSDSYASTIIYGFYKDFSTAINYPTQSICNIEIEGLT